MGFRSFFLVISTILISLIGKYSALEGGWCGHNGHKCQPGPNGKWTKCSMCVCENLDKFLRDAPTCTADKELFACFVSYDDMGSNAVVGCKTEMKTAWVIGFTISFSVICAVCFGTCTYFGYLWYLQQENKILYPESEDGDGTEEVEDVETNGFS